MGRYVGEPVETNSRWEPSVRNAWLNEGLLDVVTRSRCLEEKYTADVSAFSSAGDEVVTLPNSMYDDGILEIYWVDSNSDYHPLGEYHPRFGTIQNDDTGQPTEFFRIDRNVYLKPKPSAAGEVVIIGQRMPDELDDDTDQPLVPAAWRKLIAMYAAWLAMLDDGEYARADRMERQYLMGVKELSKLSKRRRSKRTPQMMMPFTIRTSHHYHS
jgi:hypothetical protein